MGRGRATRREIRAARQATGPPLPPAPIATASEWTARRRAARLRAARPPPVAPASSLVFGDLVKFGGL